MTDRAEKPAFSVVDDAVAEQLSEINRPCFAVYDFPTTVDGKTFRAGTWLHGIKQANGDGTSGIPYDSLICAPLRVEAETISTEDGSVGRLLRFEHRGHPVEWVMPMEAIAGRGDELLKELMRRGLWVEYNQRNLVPGYVAAQVPQRVIETTTRPGWHRSGAFVLPDRLIGGTDVRYQDSGRAAMIFGREGSLEEWQAEIGERCRGNPVLILAVACALTGPLLHKVSVSGGGVHLVGDSSSGKSLAQQLAASVWGNPRRFGASWDLSKGGIEIEASSRNHTVLILDEIKRADPRSIQNSAYMLSQGEGKGTMTREREGRPKLEWTLLTLSSGERSLSEHAAISGTVAHAGAELRMVDVNAGTRTHRAFDDLHGMDGEVFHRTLTGVATRNFGHAGPAFVEHLLNEDSGTLIEEFARRRGLFGAGDNPQAGRVADRFTVIALAGELATSYGLLPWEPEDTQAACQTLFDEWLQTVGTGNTEDRQILTAVRDFVAQHADSRFSDVDATLPDTTIRNRAGYFRIAAGRRIFLFNAPALKEAAVGFGLGRIVQALDAAGALAERGDGHHAQRKCRTPGGGSGRFYVVDPEKLEGND